MFVVRDISTGFFLGKKVNRIREFKKDLEKAEVFVTTTGAKISMNSLKIGSGKFVNPDLEIIPVEIKLKN